MGWLLLGQATVSRSVQEQSKDYPRAARYAEKRRGTKIIRAIKQGEWEMEAEEKAIIFPHSSQPWKWQWKAWVCCHKEEKKKASEQANWYAILPNQAMSKVSDFNVYAKEDITPLFSCLEYQRRKRWWAQQSFHMACANGCQAILIASITSPVAGNLA